MYLVISSSAACEQSCIWVTSSSVANSTACWGYKGDRMTGLQESYFCLSSQDFRVFSKAWSKWIIQSVHSTCGIFVDICKSLWNDTQFYINSTSSLNNEVTFICLKLSIENNLILYKIEKIIIQFWKISLSLLFSTNVFQNCKNMKAIIM